MKHYIEIPQTYVSIHKKAFTLGGQIALACAIIAILIAVFIYNNPPVVVYQPVSACTLFTPDEATGLLSGKVISLDSNKPTVTGNVATSKCSYTDSNPDANSMMVAAVAVQYGVNDKGVAQNKSDFAAAKVGASGQTVAGLGDSAYFNPTLGQLNILRDREWVIISYGIGATPATNTLDNAMKLAHLVLN